MTTLPGLLIGLLIPFNLLAQASSLDWHSSHSDSLVGSNPTVPISKYLIKAGFNLPLFEQSSIVVHWWTLGTDITLEHKIIHGLTLTTGLATNFSFAPHTQLYTINVPIGIRYYFSLGRQMKKRADRHSFFSPYLGIQTQNVLLANLRYSSEAGSGSALAAAYYYRGQLVKERTNVGNLTEWFNLGQYGYGVIGWQWQISTANYLDVNVVVPIPALIYHKAPFTLATPALVTLKYGLFW